MATGTVKAVVVGLDFYRWVDEDGTIQEEPRGTEIEVSDKEFDRIPGALEKKGSKAAKAAEAKNPGNSGASSGGWPTTHAELDALAEGVDGITVTAGDGKAKSTWNDGAVKSTADKVAALKAAGVEEPTASGE